MENQIKEQVKNECSFKFHDFVAEVGDRTFACHTIKMENCLYLWVGDSHDSVMNDLAFAIQSQVAKEPLVTKILGPVVNEESSNLAKRLSKKLSKPVYVSFNVQVDNMTLPQLERRLQEEFNSRRDIV